MISKSRLKRGVSSSIPVSLNNASYQPFYQYYQKSLAVIFTHTFNNKSDASWIYPLGNNAIPAPFIPPTETPEITSYSAYPWSNTFTIWLITPA